MLTLHFFIGCCWSARSLLKMASTGYRFARYYPGAEPYVGRGRPLLLLRVLGPLVMITSLAVLGHRVALALAGPRPSAMADFLHELFFVALVRLHDVHVLVTPRDCPGFCGRPTCS